jgi:PPOX class probable F420-dependent enzyme
VKQDAHSLKERFASSPVARLATASAVGVPHIVPVTFALRGDVLVTAVDHKPKSSGPLKRIENIRVNSRVSLLVDEYDADWTRLWWVRVDGVARLLDPGPDKDAAVLWLSEKYAQYEARPPTGIVVWVDVARISGWSYED